MLVGAELPLLGTGESPLREEDIAAGRIRGCNRIVCTRCDRPVKDFPKLYFSSRPEPAELRRAYDTNDYSKFLAVDAKARDRAYACRCDFTWVVTPLSLLDAYRRLEISWACEGHPGGPKR